jgi:hypothetical protein
MMIVGDHYSKTSDDLSYAYDDATDYNQGRFREQYGGVHDVSASFPYISKTRQP